MDRIFKKAYIFYEINIESFKNNYYRSKFYGTNMLNFYT